MRRASTCLLWLILLLHAAVPAVPGFVCVGMGGAHRLTPCCQGSDEDQGEPAWTSRCCEATPAPALEAWSGPPEPIAAAALPPATVHAPPLLPPPSPPHERAPLPRSGAPPPGPPQPRYVLRI